MLDYNDLFDALETISLMDDYEFEKIRLEFENNGYILKRNKNENGDTNITVEKKQYLYKDPGQNLGLFFLYFAKDIDYDERSLTAYESIFLRHYKG